MPLFTRRKFLGASLTTLVAGSGLYVYGRTIERHWLDIARIDLPLRRLPDAFADFTIAQISDLHLGPFVQAEHLEPVLAAVNELSADVIVITGDLVTRVTHGEPDMIVQSLSRLRAPEGVYAILGNHDWWTNGFTVAEALRSAGVTVLANEHVAIRRGGHALYLAGLDDVWCGKHDLAAALNGIPPDGGVVALVHEPDYADVVANEPRVILQLSGHSHGGQVRVPFYGGLHFPAWARKYSLGAYRIRDLTLYTNRGIGVVGQPVRFACRPEATLLTLKVPPLAV